MCRVTRNYDQKYFAMHHILLMSDVSKRQKKLNSLNVYATKFKNAFLDNLDLTHKFE